jgi:hypothetical protein
VCMVRVAVVVLLVLLLSGCGLVGGEEEDQFQGYVLRSKEEGPKVGTLFVRYKPTRSTGSVTGYIYFAYPAENPEGAFIQTERITGSVDGPRIFIQLESNSQAEYVGTVEEGKMELRQGLTEWTGGAATFQDFGEAAEDMAKASEKGNYAD